ncbi:5196_t:CDS:1, partial [Funneliformis caledonium]
RLKVSNVRNSQRYCLTSSGASARSTQSLKRKKFSKKLSCAPTPLRSLSQRLD